MMNNMVKPLASVVAKPAVFITGTFAAVALSVAGCTPDQPASDVPGTVPPVWTGSAAPSTASSGPQNGLQPVPQGEKLKSTLKLADGTEVADAEFVFQDGHATITVTANGNGKLTPGFHGMHLHSYALCEANSVAPTGGESGDFLSAGGHFNVPGHSGHPSSGDLISLNILQDGSGETVTTSDAFTREQLLAGDGTSIIIHEKADNFANIPGTRYTQANGDSGPDHTTMSTGDAGKRIACGVIAAG